MPRWPRGPCYSPEPHTPAGVCTHTGHPPLLAKPRASPSRPPAGWVLGKQRVRSLSLPLGTVSVGGVDRPGLVPPRVTVPVLDRTAQSHYSRALAPACSPGRPAPPMSPRSFWNLEPDPTYDAELSGCRSTSGRSQHRGDRWAAHPVRAAPGPFLAPQRVTFPPGRGRVHPPSRSSNPALSGASGLTGFELLLFQSISENHVLRHGL